MKTIKEVSSYARKYDFLSGQNEAPSGLSFGRLLRLDAVNA